tara:strand:- start:2870 stop:3445 length:576 start_codon:yes stop_codon:yes gene_type:complete
MRLKEKYLNNLSGKVKLIVFFQIIFIFIFSCSSGSADSEDDLIEQAFPKITENNYVLSIQDFKDVGFKALREYKSVNELPPLKSAFHGIYKKMDYELRFYIDHIDASEYGFKDADIVTGKESIVTGDVPWEDGEKDRRRCSRPPGQPHSGCNYTSKYGDYVIFGNVIVMCEGKDILESRNTCSNLLSFFKE